MMFQYAFLNAAVRYQEMKLLVLSQEEEEFPFIEQTVLMCWVCQKADRARLIDAEWEEEAVEKGGELYMTEICLYAHNRTGILLDISKVFRNLRWTLNLCQREQVNRG